MIPSQFKEIGISTFASTSEGFNCLISNFALLPYKRLKRSSVLDNQNPVFFALPFKSPVF
jgi:hypothetical protein